MKTDGEYKLLTGNRSQFRWKRQFNTLPVTVFLLVMSWTWSQSFDIDYLLSLIRYIHLPKRWWTHWDSNSCTYSNCILNNAGPDSELWSWSVYWCDWLTAEWDSWDWHEISAVLWIYLLQMNISVWCQTSCDHMFNSVRCSNVRRTLIGSKTDAVPMGTGSDIRLIFLLYWCIFHHIDILYLCLRCEQPACWNNLPS